MIKCAEQLGEHLGAKRFQVFFRDAILQSKQPFNGRSRIGVNNKGMRRKEF